MEVKAKRKLLEKTKRGLDDAIVVVEGKRDERALRETGFAPTAKIIKCGGKSAETVARQIQALESEKSEENEKTKIAVLTDFDDEGERRNAEIVDALNAEGVPPDSSLRRNFRRLLGVACIEDAPTALARLEEALSQENKGDLRKKKKTRKTKRK